MICILSKFHPHFFDLRKAFDSVPHKVLMEKLQQTGLNINILAWIGNYLTSRKQMVVVNGTSSSDSHVLSGVPQGSILGPLLFLIYIDDLTYLPISNGSHSVLYADDLLLFRPLKGREDTQLLQDDISTIDEWVQQNHLTFNSAKCKCMVISRKRRPTYSGVLYLGDTPLEQVECFKYLGVILASDLSFSQHIDSVCSKARKILGLLYRRFYNNASKDTLLQLYLSLVRLTLNMLAQCGTHTCKNTLNS